MATYLICEDTNSNPCGYAKLVDSPAPEYVTSDNNIELQRLYVNSSFQGKGVGKLLASQAEKEARNRGIHYLWLRVWDGNELARDIYINWGYVIIGNEPYEVGNENRTVLLMEKALSHEQ